MCVCVSLTLFSSLKAHCQSVCGSVEAESVSEAWAVARLSTGACTRAEIGKLVQLVVGDINGIDLKHVVM